MPTFQSRFLIAVSSGATRGRAKRGLYFLPSLYLGKFNPILHSGQNLAKIRQRSFFFFLHLISCQKLVEFLEKSPPPLAKTWLRARRCLLVAKKGTITERTVVVW